MGNNQSSGNTAGGAAAAGAGSGGHRRSGSRSQPSAAAASLSTFQNQATIHRLRQHQQRQSSSKSTATQSSSTSRGSGGARRSRSPSPSGRASNLSTPASGNPPSKAQTPLSPEEKPTSPASILSASSTSTAGGGGGNGPRRRKSIELPDLDPSLAFTNANQSGSSAATPLADIHMTSRGGASGFGAGKRPFGDLSAFKLRLPDKQRARLLDAASSAGSTSSAATEAQMRSGIEAMRLDEGEDHPGDGPAGIQSGASASTHAQHIAPSAPTPKASALSESAVRTTPTTDSLTTTDDSRDTSGAATPQEQFAKMAAPEIEIEGTSAASPSAIAPDTDAVPIGISQAPYPLATSPSVLIPLQQPIETVVPPLPPTIMKPFPPPLPVAPVSSGSSAAAVHKVAAATEAVRQAPALDVGAGPDGVPTLIIWKEPANEVYVTGTFCRWKQQIKLRKDPEAPDQTDFSALVSLSPGPHRLKFIVDKKWKTSKYLPTATDAAGNLINYLQVEIGDQPFRGLGPRGMWSGYTYGNWSLGMVGSNANAGAGSAVLDPHDSEWHENDDDWTTDIPVQLLEYEDVFDHVDSDDGEIRPPPEVMPGPGEKGYSTEPPKLPAQLTQGILNMGSKALESVTDDNSLLPKPDHSVLNHLAASPIKHGLLSVGVTTRYKRKYLTTVYYRRLNDAPQGMGR